MPIEVQRFGRQLSSAGSRREVPWLHCLVAALLILIAMFALLPQRSAAQSARPERSVRPAPALPTGSAAVIARELYRTRDAARSALTPPDEPALAGLSGRASRDGPMLWLKLEGDLYLKLFDEGRCEGFGTCLLHRLVAWWPQQRIYVVQYSHGEGGGAYLIAAGDGRMTTIVAKPVLSPSGQRAIAYNGSLIDGPDIEIVELGAAPPRVQAVDLRHACLDRLAGDWLSVHVPVWLDEGRIGFAPTDRPTAPGKSPVLTIREGRGTWSC
jgi:hypothetical protein